MIPDFATHLALAQMDIGPFAAKATSFEGAQEEASVDLCGCPPMGGCPWAFGNVRRAGSPPIGQAPPSFAISCPVGWK